MRIYILFGFILALSACAKPAPAPADAAEPAHVVDSEAVLDVPFLPEDVTQVEIAPGVTMTVAKDITVTED